MTTIKSYTDLEQSKKLAEFLPIETADFQNKTIESNSDEDVDGVSYVIHPCWSLAALLKLLPSEFTTENKFGKYKYKIEIRKYKFTDNVDLYQIAYGNYKLYEDGSISWKDMINTAEKENLIDVAFDMICWLKESKKL